jgi:putative heme iron utilization protein
MAHDVTAPAPAARALIRSLDRASLATLMRADGTGPGSPYASLVMVAIDHDLSPIMLISTLADHTRNLRDDARASLLFDGTQGLDEPLTGPRVSVQGRVAVTTEARHRERYLARHPGAAMYAGFKDFAFHRLTIEAAHLVAGFGRIHWLDAGAIGFDAAPARALAEAERDILAHMNADHAEAVRLYATRLLGRPEGAWIMTGIDPEGCDLRLGGAVARLAFDRVALDAEGARAELVRLARRARA